MIVYKIFVPFMVYLTFTIMYMTYIFEKKAEFNDSKLWKLIDSIFLGVVLAFVLFFSVIERRQIFR